LPGKRSASPFHFHKQTAPKPGRFFIAPAQKMAHNAKSLQTETMNRGRKMAHSAKDKSTALQFLRDNLGWILSIAAIAGSYWVVVANNAITKKAVDNAVDLLTKVQTQTVLVNNLDRSLTAMQAQVDTLSKEKTKLDLDYAATRKWVDSLKLLKEDKDNVVNLVKGVLDVMRTDPKAVKLLSAVTVDKDNNVIVKAGDGGATTLRILPRHVFVMGRLSTTVGVDHDPSEDRKVIVKKRLPFPIGAGPIVDVPTMVPPTK
jgi:hypothetical protein